MRTPCRNHLRKRVGSFTPFRKSPRPKRSAATQRSREGGFTPALLSWDTGTHYKTETKSVPTSFHSGTEIDDHKCLHLSSCRVFHRLRRIRFGDMCGTAGQEGLNIILTTIKCPTKVSHFWDARDSWDGKGRSYPFRCDPAWSVHNSRPHRST